MVQSMYDETQSHTFTNDGYIITTVSYNNKKNTITIQEKIDKKITEIELSLERAQKLHEILETLLEEYL